MPRHKLEVIKLLIIAIDPVKLLSQLNVLGPFPNFSRKGSNNKLYLAIVVGCYDNACFFVHFISYEA